VVCPIIVEMKNLRVLAFFLVLATQSLVAQNPVTILQTPFVSRLTAIPNGPEVILSWKDAIGSSNSNYEIHRHVEVITDENVDITEKIAVIAPGIETYTDRPTEGSLWWYAVMTVHDGEPVKIIIPWRNTVAGPVGIVDSSAIFDDAAEILSITSELAGPMVRIHFISDLPDRDVTVFRSTTPVMEKESLDHAIIVGSGTARNGKLEDFPMLDIPWYYTAVDTELFESGNPNWHQKAGFSDPIILSGTGFDGTGTTSMRPAPLPILRITRSVNDGRQIPQIDGVLPVKTELSKEALSALAAALNPDQGTLWVKPEPVILEIDRGSSDERRQLLLKEILESSFNDKKWAESETELFALSATNGLDGAEKARILFYSGQCQYFQDNLPSAFLSFLLASDHYYVESRDWMLMIYGDLIPVSGF
jgi:hypothetical protein